MPSCVKRSFKSIFLFGVYFRIISFILYFSLSHWLYLFWWLFPPCKIWRIKLVEDSCINDDFLFKRLKLSFAVHLFRVLFFTPSWLKNREKKINIFCTGVFFLQTWLQKSLLLFSSVFRMFNVSPQGALQMVLYCSTKLTCYV